MIAVMTTRRPTGVSYLYDTLRSIGSAGDRRRVLVSDGPLPPEAVVPDDWEVITHAWRGARATGWECLQLALAAGVKDLLLLQDDILVCDGGGEVMDACPVPDNCIATTFYSMQALPGLQPKGRGEPRLIVIGASGTAQALKIPRRAIEYLCRQNPRAAPNHVTDEPHLFDDAMFAFARESPWPHIAHLVPNVVRHVGEVSACGTRKIFHQPWSVLPGESFPGDVARLPVHETPYRQSA